MDIGTTKPDAAELSAAPHRLLDILDPAGRLIPWRDFRRDALAEMADTFGAGRIPLYWLAEQCCISKRCWKIVAFAFRQIRRSEARIEQQAIEQGWNALHQQLAGNRSCLPQRVFHPK